MPRDVEVLSRELGCDPPEAFSVLTETHLAALTATLRAARARQKNELDHALSAALEHIPALLRGPVRKILGL